MQLEIIRWKGLSFLGDYDIAGLRLIDVFFSFSFFFRIALFA